MRLFVLLLCVACGAGHIPDPIPATTKNAKQVRAVLDFTSRRAWIQTPWYRVTEDVIDWPRRVVLAVDNSVCFVPEFDVYTPLQNDWYACGSRWRYAR